eukprot:Nitzschia sp. Nitz4//scaffold307_size21646//13824//15683//NITZ4_008599-RA/size21646-processed-gene-0.15-mRNA-1//-1//CDS//3329547142//2768//frame0
MRKHLLFHCWQLKKPTMSSTNTTGRDPEKGPLNETTSLLNDDDNKKERTSEQQPVQASDTNWAQTWSLAFSMLVQSYLLVSVFPYSGFLAMKLVPGLNEETAGSYAGLIASSFMVGRTFSSFEWGKAADKYGRTFVIKASLVLSAILSILFGISSTFAMAIFTRFLLGVCNGLIGPIKTIISELSHGDQSRETRMIAIVGGMWGYGFLLNPAIGGFLSDPVKQYPDSLLVEGARPLLTAYPFLLPNVVGCLVCVVGFVLMQYNVEETLPEARRQDFHLFPCWMPRNRASLVRRLSSWGLFKHLHFTNTETGASKEEHLAMETSLDQDLPKWVRPSPSTTALVMLAPKAGAGNQQQPSQGQDEEENDEASFMIEDSTSEEAVEDHKPATIQSLWARTSTRNHLLIYWVYSFLIIAVDETFPLYCISRSSGLGIQEKTIGSILSGTGVFYILLQYVLVTKLVDWYGFYVALRISALCSVPIVALIPISLMTNRDAAEGTLNSSTLVFLCLIYAIARSFSSVTFSTLTLTTNRTVPAHQRATMNGFSMLGGSLGKAAGPAFAGFLFSTSVNHVQPPYGSVVAYEVIGVLGVCLFLTTLLLEERLPDETADPIHIQSQKFAPK